MYHYKESGLRDVWLVNGYERRSTPYGQTIAIRDVEGLHRAICLRLIVMKPRLTGAEFRLIRKDLDMSQARLASFLGNDAQSVALWERHSRVPAWADRFIRALYREVAEGNAHIMKLVERLNEMDQAAHEKLTFESTGRGWKAKVAA
jgi:DNA-binding transcriptional regulator YiaG